MTDFKKRLTRLPLIAALVALLALLLLLASGPLRRMDLIGIRAAIDLVKWSGQLAIASAVLSLAAALWARPGKGRKGLGLAVGGLVVSVALIANLLSLKNKVEGVPPIHDITTDTEDPPAFVAVIPFRTTALNPIEYEGAALAAQQKAAYPDLRPLDLPVPPAAAFEKAKAAVRAMGWKVVKEDSERGTIEATDTTPWLGFEDDVVVRIKTHEGGARVDVRSLSRVGQSDLGKNAERIRIFLAQLKS